MVNPFKNPAIISFYTGIWGLERGLERVLGTVRTVAYVERESVAIYNLVASMEKGLLDPAPVWNDDHTFPGERFYGKVHGITAGYPCQPSSSAGLKKGVEDDRWRWPYLYSQFKAIGPVWGFFENVENHFNHGFDQVVTDLKKADYSVEVGIFSAEEVGAPHERRRIFILAVANTYLDASQRHSGKVSGKGKKVKGTPQGEYRERCRDGLTGGGQVVGNSTGEGWQGCEPRTSGRFSQSVESGEDVANTGFIPQQIQVEGRFTEFNESGITRQRRVDRWPAGQGRFQYDWEDPRTVEPGMGITVDGYNFRDDLLRLLGNSVLEAVAEKAFIVLIKKHGLSHLIE